MPLKKTGTCRTETGRRVGWGRKLVIKILSALLLAVASYPNWALAETSVVSKGWSVTVRPISDGGADQAEWYWVGLRNEGPTPRAFCALGVRYVYDLPDGTTVDEPTVEYPEVDSPHPCDLSAGHLLLPGETYFVRVRPERSRLKAGRVPIRFWITADEVCAGVEPCKKKRIQTEHASAQ